MAIATKTLGGFDDGLCRFELDYDDVNLRLTVVRCINNTAQPASAQATATANGRTATRIFAANSTVELAIPTGPTTRLDVTIDGRGRLDGVDYQLAWPT